MKFLVVFSAVLAISAARPGLLQATYITPLVPIASQYHSQDTLGQYAYGYAAQTSARSESRSVDGVTSGVYSYVDATGQVQTVSYTADAANGFRVAGTNIPVAPEAPRQEEPRPVEDTPEVANARAEHMATVDAIRARDAAIVASDPGDAGDNSSEEGQSVEVAQSVVQVPQVPVVYSAPAVHYVQPYSLIPGVYSYNVPVVYTNGHPASDLPHDDAAVAQARSEHETAHQEVRSNLAAAGVEVN